MPGIKRAQRGYRSVGVVDVTEPEVKPAARFCIRCKEMFAIYAVLGSRVLPLDKNTGNPIPKPADYDQWLECRNCGTVYAKYEVKQEVELAPIIEPDASPFDRGAVIMSVGEKRKFDRTGKTQAKKKKKQELDNIKDPDLKLELKKPGTELSSYHEERQRQ